MKFISNFPLRLLEFPFLVLVAMLILFLPVAARAFPPAPDALIYGQVKDQYGNLLVNTGDQVIFQTTAGGQVTTGIQSETIIDTNGDQVNYILRVPMDSWTLPVPYVTGAVTNATPGLLYVTVGNVTNLPVEMQVTNYVRPISAQIIRQNLTLPGSGNVSSNPVSTNAFSVSIINQHGGSVGLSFTTAAGATYSVYGSTDLIHWIPISFTVPANGTPTNTSYLASTVQALVIQTVQASNAPPIEFFRLEHQ